MRILHYCQHVLGLGHYFRSLEIAKALSGHEVLFVSGGPRVDCVLPPHVREFRLRSLEMDPEFKGFEARDSQAGDNWLERLKNERREALLAKARKFKPEAALIELYPFGRRAFEFELLPLLDYLKELGCPVYCSLRDILVEKSDQAKFEKRVLEKLNRYFKGLFVHSDPAVIRLEDTFSRVDEIAAALSYTGYVCKKPPENTRDDVRRELGLWLDEKLVVASAGGGRVGFELLQSVLLAWPKFCRLGGRARLIMLSGPYMEQVEFEQLEILTAGLGGVELKRFERDFARLLGGADLSLSLAGYNTVMNVLGARVPALVWPFAQNREQGMRADRLAELGVLGVLKLEDLESARLAGLMRERLEQGFSKDMAIDLEGAAHTARLLAPGG